MIDMARRDGLEISAERLSEALGVPVIETVAVRRKGMEQLREALALIKKDLNVTSATIASFDPKYDPQGKTLTIGLGLIKQILDMESAS